MNKILKQHLTSVVTATVNEDAVAAKEAFREYISLKTQSILLGEEEDKNDEAVDKDLDDVDAAVKKTKKDQKKDDEDEDKEDDKKSESKSKKKPFEKKDDEDKDED